MKFIAVLIVAISIFCFARPAAAFDYVVEGRGRHVRVDVDEELFWTGASLAIAGYAMPILIGSVMAANSEGNDQFVPLGLSTVPVVGGGLLGNHFLDQMEAQDAKEGWAVMPAGVMWMATIGQAVGLVLTAASLIGADRTIVEE